MDHFCYSLQSSLIISVQVSLTKRTVGFHGMNDTEKVFFWGGVTIVALYNELSGCMSPQYFLDRLCDLRAKGIAFHMVLLNLSTCILLVGKYALTSGKSFLEKIIFQFFRHERFVSVGM